MFSNNLSWNHISFSLYESQYITFFVSVWWYCTKRQALPIAQPAVKMGCVWLGKFSFCMESVNTRLHQFWTNWNRQDEKIIEMEWVGKSKKFKLDLRSYIITLFLLFKSPYKTSTIIWNKNRGKAYELEYLE